MARSTLKPLRRALCLASLWCGFSSSVFASGFGLWEQDVTDIENFHAGRAVLANDASTAYTNPAGITRIQNQQLVVGAAGIMTDIKFTGTVSTCLTLPGDIACVPGPENVAQGGTFNLVPNLHYVAPITPKIGFGISVVTPFGSDVEWGQSSFVNAIVTRARLQVVDIAPALGFNITDKLSFGVGVDIEKMSAELNSILVANPAVTKGYDTAYGYHGGVMYQFTPATRAGLAYHSQVVHHLKGTSNWIGTDIWSRENTKVNLPPDTTLSVYHQLNSKWAVMGTVVYTQWNVVHNLVINNIAGLDYPLGVPELNFPQEFRNSWTYSLGADYSPTDNLTLRAGAGYDQTPTRNAYRILQLPDNDRYDIAVGGHYQITKAIGFDLGWTRVFLKNSAINPPLHPELYPLFLQPSVTGTMKASADVVGAQLTWNIT